MRERVKEAQRYCLVWTSENIKWLLHTFWYILGDAEMVLYQMTKTKIQV